MVEEGDTLAPVAPPVAAVPAGSGDDETAWVPDSPSLHAVLQSALHHIRSHGAVLLGIALALQTPTFAFDLIRIAAGGTGRADLLGWALVGLKLAVGYVLLAITSAVIVRVVSKDESGRTATLGQAIDHVMVRLDKLLLTSVTMLGLVTAGLMLLVVPGIVLGIRFAFAALLVTMEDLSGWPALARSKELTRGSEGLILSLSSLLGVATLAVNAALLGLLDLGIAPSAPHHGAARIFESPVPAAGPLVARSVVGFLLRGGSGAIHAVALSVLYLGLRAKKRARG